MVDPECPFSIMRLLADRDTGNGPAVRLQDEAGRGCFNLHRLQKIPETGVDSGQKERNIRRLLQGDVLRHNGLKRVLSD